MRVKSGAGKLDECVVIDERKNQTLSICLVAVLSVLVGASAADDPITGGADEDVPTSLRTTALVLMMLCAAPPLCRMSVPLQRAFLFAALVVIGASGSHVASACVRTSDCAYVAVALCFLCMLAYRGGLAPTTDAECSPQLLLSCLLVYASTRGFRSAFVYAGVAEKGGPGGDGALKTTVYSPAHIAPLAFGHAVLGIASGVLSSGSDVDFAGPAGAVVIASAALAELGMGDAMDNLNGVLFGDTACLSTASDCPVACSLRRFVSTAGPISSLWLGGLALLAWSALVHTNRVCAVAAAWRRDAFLVSIAAVVMAAILYSNCQGMECLQPGCMLASIAAIGLIWSRIQFGGDAYEIAALLLLAAAQTISLLTYKLDEFPSVDGYLNVTFLSVALLIVAAVVHAAASSAILLIPSDADALLFCKETAAHVGSSLTFALYIASATAFACANGSLSAPISDGTGASLRARWVSQHYLPMFVWMGLSCNSTAKPEASLLARLSVLLVVCGNATLLGLVRSSPPFWDVVEVGPLISCSVVSVLAWWYWTAA